jgi:hypothetical protein
MKIYTGTVRPSGNTTNKDNEKIPHFKISLLPGVTISATIL